MTSSLNFVSASIHDLPSLSSDRQRPVKQKDTLIFKHSASGTYFASKNNAAGARRSLEQRWARGLPCQRKPSLWMIVGHFTQRHPVGFLATAVAGMPWSRTDRAQFICETHGVQIKVDTTMDLQLLPPTPVSSQNARIQLHQLENWAWKAGHNMA